MAVRLKRRRDLMQEGRTENYPISMDWVALCVFLALTCAIVWSFIIAPPSTEDLASNVSVSLLSK